MTYGHSKAKLTIFSPNREKLQELTDRLRKNIEQSGAENNGPINLPQADPGELYSFLNHLKHPESEDTQNQEQFPGWLFDAASTEDNINAMVMAADSNSLLYARKYEVFGESGIQSALTFELPDDVFAATELGQRNHHKGSGHDPYTFDPNVDHITPPKGD